MEDWRAAQATGPVSGQALMQQAVTQLAPSATTFTQGNNLGTLQSQVIKPVTQAKGSIVDQLVNWSGSVAHTIGDVAGTAANYVAKSAVDLVLSPGRFTGNVINEVNLSQKTDAINQQLSQQQIKMSSLLRDYQANRITQVQYKQALADMSKTSNSLQQEASDNATAVTDNANNQVQNTIDVVSSVATVIATVGSLGLADAGIGAMAVAADAIDGSVPKLINFFGQRAVSDEIFSAASKIDDIVNSVIKNVNVVTTFGNTFPEAAIAQIAKDTIENGAVNLTTKQIAKNVAINVLVKKPIIYNTNVGLVSDVFKDIATGDLTGAALTTVASAGMAVTGGPLGWAIGKLGKGTEWLKAAAYSGSFNTDLAKKMAEGNAANLKSGLAAKYSQELIDNLANSTTSRQSFIDNISLHIGDGGDSGAIAHYLQAELDKGNVLPYKAMKVMEEVNMKMTGGDAAKAASLVTDFWNTTDGGTSLGNMTAKDLVDNMVKWAVNRESLVNWAVDVAKLPQATAEKFVLGRANGSDMQMLVDLFKQTDTNIGSAMVDGRLDPEIAQKIINTRLQMFDEISNRLSMTSAFANSASLQSKIKSLITNNPLTDELEKAIRGIKTGTMYDASEFGGLPKELEAQLTRDGHIPILPKNTYTPHISMASVEGSTLKTAYSSELSGLAKNQTGDSLFEQAVKPVPVLQSITNLFTKFGLSPEASAGAVQDAFQTSFNALMHNTPVLGAEGRNMTGEEVVNKLSSYIRNLNSLPGIHAPIMDLRQMTLKEVQLAINGTEAEAKSVAKAIMQSNLDISLAVKGLGSKLQDLASVIPGFSKYTRLQGAGRFALNPFFAFRRGMVTELNSDLYLASEGLSKTPQFPGLGMVNKMLFGEQSAEIKTTVQFLEDRNIFPSGYSGEASVDNMVGKIGTRITTTEKKSLAGVVMASARRMGMDVPTFVNNNEGAVVDMLKTITLQGRHGIGDSALARTLNIAFFPMRHNLQVANLMASYIGKLNAPTQVALITNFINADKWLSSDVGVAWQSQNAEAIGLFSYISPLYGINYVMKLAGDVANPNEARIGDLGELGGLPFGAIGMILEANGIITTQAPYLNPKTGSVLPDYVPETAKAKISIAIQDFLSSMFSYPGATIGLPGKGTALRNLANGITGATSADETVVDQTNNLTPDQVHEKAVIDATNGTNTPSVPATGSPTTSPSQPTRIKSTLPPVTPKYKTSTSTAKKKKSQFLPTPL